MAFSFRLLPPTSSHGGEGMSEGEGSFFLGTATTCVLPPTSSQGGRGKNSAGM